MLEGIAGDKQRILLTPATGTGKTFMSFAIAWKLFHARWNVSRPPTRRPRLLFLADRNILADQASPFDMAAPGSPSLKFKYSNAIADAVAELGAPEDIGKLFTSFQRYLYLEQMV